MLAGCQASGPPSAGLSVPLPAAPPAPAVPLSGLVRRLTPAGFVPAAGASIQVSDRQTTADAQGAWRLEVPQAPATLVVALADHVPVQLAVRPPLARLNLPLSPPDAPLAGVLLDPRGAAVPGGTVVATAAGLPKGRAEWQADADGFWIGRLVAAEVSGSGGSGLTPGLDGVSKAEPLRPLRGSCRQAEGVSPNSHRDPPYPPCRAPSLQGKERGLYTHPLADVSRLGGLMPTPDLRLTAHGTTPGGVPVETTTLATTGGVLQLARARPLGTPTQVGRDGDLATIAASGLTTAPDELRVLAGGREVEATLLGGGRLRVAVAGPAKVQLEQLGLPGPSVTLP